MSERIAIIGGGIAGLTAGYLLHRHHQVTLFEKRDRLGGNALTIDTHDGHAVDVAVAAFGRAGFKNFYRLLDHVGVEAVASPGAFMSLHNLDTGSGLYVTPTLSGLLAQRFSLLRPSNLRSLYRLRTGLAAGQRMLEAGALEGLSMEEALARIPRMTGETRLLLLCALCLLSSMDCQEILTSPAAFFFAKLRVHNDVISPRASHSVRCIPGGTRRYVAALGAAVRERAVLNARIQTVRRDERGATIVLDGGEQRRFDKVVFACNADQALALLAQPTDREREVLGAWRYKDGQVVVHTDHSAFPPRELMQAYTFLYTEHGSRMQTSVNGALWFEPGVDKSCNHISSQHPNFPIRGDLIEYRTVLRTPIFDAAACKAAPELPSLNGVLSTWYCGSHFGFGLHEDAVTSALAVACDLGAGPL